MMDDIIKQIVSTRDAYLERLIKDLPVGSTLCFHETSSDLDFLSNTYTYTENFHILGSNEECIVEGRRTQYGPKSEGLW